MLEKATHADRSFGLFQIAHNFLIQPLVPLILIGVGVKGGQAEGEVAALVYAKEAVVLGVADEKAIGGRLGRVGRLTLYVECDAGVLLAVGTALGLGGFGLCHGPEQEAVQLIDLLSRQDLGLPRHIDRAGQIGYLVDGVGIQNHDGRRVVCLVLTARGREGQEEQTQNGCDDPFGHDSSPPSFVSASAEGAGQSPSASAVVSVSVCAKGSAGTSPSGLGGSTVNFFRRQR